MTHSTYIAYTVYLGCRLMDLVDETNHRGNRSTIELILGLWLLFHAIVQSLICGFCAEKKVSLQ